MGQKIQAIAKAGKDCSGLKAEESQMRTDPNENPQTAELEEAVKSAGLWDRYQDFVQEMTDTANIKYAHVSEEQKRAFIKTCKYSYCAGVNEAFLKIYEDFNLDEDKRH